MSSGGSSPAPARKDSAEGGRGLPSAAIAPAQIPDDLFDSIDQTAHRLDLSAQQIVHDYLLHKGLYGLASQYPPRSTVPDPGYSTDAGTWAFAGGTSLVSAHRLVDRWSEDIDLVLVPQAGIAKRAARRAQKHLVQTAAAALDPDPGQHRWESGRDVATVMVATGIGEVRFDASQQPTAPNIIVGAVVASLLGRHADRETVADHPELGGFNVPALAVPVTAVNKMMTLHRLASTGDDERIFARARDLSDLACIAASPHHASETRRRAAELAELLDEGGVSRKGQTPRPDHGYLSGPEFQPGASSRTALEDGYLAMQDMLWGTDHPDFEETLAAARSLDQPSGQ
ncbi:nucleotidyl transferase AbiEii/AbiGii toxin family protein [Candidatus Poriferisocius sp.]|uniref:nucleotidyl transferase AbiEii/AbiGii toxin family protein n=1 Tax=Candidatus Poriferisocius sp. TaxID=3101276 RepID=UPI003B015324